MYKIGELSKLCKLPVKTLRYYDSVGLLVPDEIDIFTGYRYYSASKLIECNKIIALKELGFTLEEISKQMNTKNAEDIVALITAKQEELENLKSFTESQLKRLSSIEKIISGKDEVMYNIIVRSTDIIHVAVVRRIFTEKNEAFLQIEKMRSEIPIFLLGKRNVIINYETEYCESDFDLAACVELAGKLPKGSNYIEKEIALPSDIASLVCKKDELDKAYSSMTKYLEEAPCQIIGAFYEIYYDDGTVELKVPVCKLSVCDNNHKNDDITIPFENDIDVIGKWELIDIVPSEKQFNILKAKSNYTDFLQELYFLPQGQGYWVVKGWTKGYLLTECGYPSYFYKNKYTIKTVDGQKLLFLEFKDYEHESHGGMPIIWVYKQVSNKEFDRDEIKIQDNVDFPFINDLKIIGKWVVCDFVREIEDFNPSRQNFNKEKLFFISVEFNSDGTVTKVFEPHVNRSYTISWTKGALLDKNQLITEAYEIKVINKTEYLFIEWKSGDYVFGGQKPCYYVFVRE